jgi:hypothetical protein
MKKYDDLIIPIKCDLCPKEAIWFQSPLLNPDEPKLCNEHYNKYKRGLK